MALQKAAKSPLKTLSELARERGYANSIGPYWNTAWHGYECVAFHIRGDYQVMDLVSVAPTALAAEAGMRASLEALPPRARRVRARKNVRQLP